MHAKVFSATTLGIDSHLVEVEADLANGLINFHIVGLPDKAISESSKRILAALKNCGFRLPPKLITINLAPANLKKQNVLFDVPISVAILQAAGLLNLTKDFINETFFLGELALDGKIRPVNGVLSVAHGALKLGKKRLIIPKQNCQEASLIKGLEIIGVEDFVELVEYLRGEKSIEPTKPTFDNYSRVIKNHPLDFNQVKGQFAAKRALQITAAGMHNILFIGPPGSGKTMLAKRFATILPEMSFDEIIQATKIYSIAGLLKNNSRNDSLVFHRPFRSPHHTISQAGLVGGGSNPKPGEISLAHHGVLFLDELAEFKRSTLEVLRQPMESKRVLISRANSSIEYPASFLLIAALNPCPCGYYGDKKKKCVCTSSQIQKYFGKLSGPLLDRIDLHVNVSAVDYDDIKNKDLNGKSSEQMALEVNKAVEVQRKRGIKNAFMSAPEVEKYCILTTDAEDTLKKAFEKLNLSMRGYHKILKIARTIADLCESDLIEKKHIREAIMYRTLDRLSSPV